MKCKGHELEKRSFSFADKIKGREVIISLKKALLKRGYLTTINENIDDEFKQALMQFQIDNNLPIGQFDEMTIEVLLED